MKNENYTNPVNVSRYVYHISYQRNRQSILQNGLKANSKPNTIGYENAVFAHNYSFLDLNWYPLVLDFYDWTFWCDETETELDLSDNEMILRGFKNHYDVWRIDTTKLGKEWFRDDVGEKDFNYDLFGVERRPENLYVVSFGDIPRDCIELAKLEEEYTRKEFHWGLLEIKTLRPVA
jgi:hypothetical protein